jgi:acetylserotonin N-methyltransferase
MADVPSPEPILDLMTAFRNSATLFTAVSLDLFDHLAQQPATVAELASKTQTNPDALQRLLELGVGLGLFQRTGETFHNSPTAQTYLTRTSPRRMTGYIRYSDRVLWKMWGNLADAIREGSHRWKQSFDLDGPIFSSFFRTDDDKREFLMGMHGFGQISSPEVVKAFDLSGFTHLVDLGGATGHLAIAACRQYPTMRATVFDLPTAIPLAQEIISGESMQEKVGTAAGDFFVDALPGADLYAVGRILHDWSEEKIERLLGRIYAALPAGGALLICEKLLNDDRNGPLWATQQSLNMLVCTEGKERTLGEYQALLHKAGFGKVEGRRTSSPLDAVLAYRS